MCIVNSIGVGLCIVNSSGVGLCIVNSSGVGLCIVNRQGNKGTKCSFYYISKFHKNQLMRKRVFTIVSTLDQILENLTNVTQGRSGGLA